jgi:hypothetical protein
MHRQLAEITQFFLVIGWWESFANTNGGEE